MPMTEIPSANGANTQISKSSNTNSATTENEAENFSERLRLKIQPHPPKFPFRGTPFEITVYLVDSADHLKSGVTVPLDVELYSADKKVPIEKKIMEIDPKTPPIMKGDGICKLNISISECSMALSNRKFIIHISAVKSCEFQVTPAETSEMTVIQHRLLIQEELPELWYKDEGGRDKCMTLPIHLVDAKGDRVGNRPVPLRVTLLYENEQPVWNQDILKISPDCQRTIDANGKALLKLRIEEVSKNHQNRSFRLKVEADTTQSPLNFDVAFDLSSAILVKSKRNKKRHIKQTPAHITHHIITGTSTPHSATSSPSSNPDTEASAVLAMATATNFPGGSFTAEDRRKKIRTSSSITASPGSIQPHHNLSNTTLTRAMESVLSWTGGVVHGLQQLEWQVVGYESKVDGSSDPDRPIYRCPACWRYKDVMTYETAQHDSKCLIANLLLTYMTDTMGHLDFILKSIEQHPQSQQMHQNSMRYQSQKQMANHDGEGSPLSPPMMINSSGNVGSNQFASLNASGSPPGPPTLSRGLTDIIQGMDAPPELLRGTSGGITEFMRSLDDNNETATDSSYYSRTTTSTRQASSHITNAIEAEVFYVLARMVTLNSSSSIGFPAFDSLRNLLGFYQEVRGESSATEVVFVPVSSISAITQNEVSQTQRLLRSEIKNNSSAVHTLSRCNNDLVKLKEDVVLFHWNAKDQGSSAW